MAELFRRNHQLSSSKLAAEIITMKKGGKLTWLNRKTHTQFVHFAVSEAVKDHGRERDTQKGRGEEGGVFTHGHVTPVVSGDLQERSCCSGPSLSLWIPTIV